MNILVTGAGGQLGTVFTQKLNAEYGSENVVLSDIHKIQSPENKSVILDVTDFERIQEIIDKHDITHIYHFAAILSANGEKNPRFTKEVNSDGFFNILEASRKHNIQQVFYPSSIAVFGSHVPGHAPQHSVLYPTTVYGITKAEGENWSQYYFDKYGLDVRSLRFPGVIGHESMPGGGTTDYAVDIFYSAIKGEKFTCFLEKDEKLPMIYMDDALNAIIQLMNAPKENINIRTSYNLGGLSFSPEEIFSEIKKHQPDFEIEYVPDFRQEIAASWPDSLDDSDASKDWNWKPKYELPELVKDMIENITKKNQQANFK